MNHSPCVCSVDIGTSSVRSRLFDALGEEIPGSGAQIAYTMTRTPDGGEFIDLPVLFELVIQTIDQAVSAAAAHQREIAAVACCTFWHNVAGLDADGVPYTPLLSWSDTRPECMLAELEPRLDPAYTQRTGCPLHASYLPAKILWLNHNLLPIIRRVHSWMSIGEYLLYRLTEERRCSYSMASASGLFNAARLEWDHPTLDAIGVAPDQLSPLCDLQDGVKTLRPEWASRWPALRQAVWFPALGDGAASHVGCGCSSPDYYSLMVGTSGAMRVAWKGEYQPPPAGLWCYRIDGMRPVQGGALSNGGNLVEWMRSTLLLPPAEELELELSQLPPDGHGLTLLPFLAGQRSPRWNPHRRGTIHGLRLATRPIQILQAGLEAVAFRFRLIHDLLAARFPAAHEIVATGGGLLRSPAWIQIMADVLGHPVVVSGVTEASCRGAALLALESLGILGSLQNAQKHFGLHYAPRPEAQKTYESALQRHLDLEAVFNSVL